MAFAISVKALGPTGTRLKDHWTAFGRFESAPSMSALGYAPHITLAVYDRVPEQKLRDALRAAFADGHALRLTFDRLSYFEAPQLVFWAAPMPSPPLRDAHVAVHGTIDPSLCRPHYRPGNWTPHATLATNVRPDQVSPAIALASQPIEPFDVVFDAADCVEFPPIRIIEQRRLLAVD